MRPQLDSQQDWILSYSRGENGVTTLRFYRQLDTGDATNDTVIQVRVFKVSFEGKKERLTKFRLEGDWNP